MRTITINSETFEYLTKSNNKPVKRHTTIYECYKKPSQTKIDIYHDWVSWFLEITELENDNEETKLISGDIYIVSHNIFQFCLGGYLLFANGNNFGFYISKSHQYIWVLD